MLSRVMVVFRDIGFSQKLARTGSPLSALVRGSSDAYYRGRHFPN